MLEGPERVGCGGWCTTSINTKWGTQASDSHKLHRESHKILESSDVHKS